MALFKGTKKTDDATKEVKEVNVEKEAKKTTMKDLYVEGAPVKAEKGGTAEAVMKRKVKGNAYRILVKPLVTEKVTIIGNLNKYGFEVAKNANKIEITNAIEEVYGVRPVSVNIITLKGKKVRYGKISGQRKNKKKAYITLPEGKSIKIYEGV